MSSTIAERSAFIDNARGLLKTMRPYQWHKNIFVYAGLVFDGKLLNPELFLATTLVVLSFCMASSSVYLLNDLVDLEKDRLHPRKRNRPLPSGQLNPRLAMIASFVLAVCSLLITTWLDPWVGLVIAIYLLQNIAYSFYLKNVVILDVMIIAFGFLLRIIAGVMIVHVAHFSPWLYVCAAMLMLFLGFGKRRQEMLLLEEGAAGHRASLENYNLALLDQILVIVVTITLVAYTFYTFEAETALASGGRLLLTAPLVLYGMLRYLYLIHVKKMGGAPEELVLKDRHLLITCVLWAILVVSLIYFV
ncbi:MAG: decaprenyl-phosphate phosphoribosyltransferase [Caldilineaceae bacterium]|nr:decaprenyl-phosphate phosphoribosyltransferase [Caldilineaceae bacterium]MCB0145874.1 decaprenyl-phosphate phosphoribosyltransferase [Caldilineaceae bacterium]MCB9149335.1 decaprenyl-phosphate phosphoribosyltransferase [Caldilineaceae bacterium]